MDMPTSNKVPLMYDTDLETGRLCLNFANTVSWRGKPHPEEHLRNYRELVKWSQSARILTRNQAQRILEESKQHHLETEAVFKRAIALREAIARILSAISEHLAPSSSDLATLNRELAVTMAKTVITKSKRGYNIVFKIETEALNQMLWPITRSAADLLTSDRLDRIRMCADEQCGWFFLDMSRNRSRRWCDMKDCGNRAKAQRHYRRRHAGSCSHHE